MRVLFIAFALAALLAGSASALPVPTGQTRVAFQGSASLFTYYSGASWALRRAGIIVPGKTKLSGLSGGAHTSVMTTLGMTGPDQREFWINTIIESITQLGDFQGVFNALLDERLTKAPFVGAAKKVSGKVTIAMSQLDSSKYTFANSAVWVVNKYKNDNDLASVLTATSQLPCFTSRNTYAVYQGQPVLDGAFANGFEELCVEGTATSRCIKVGTWYVAGKYINPESPCDPGLCTMMHMEDENCKVKERTDRIRMRGGRPAYWNSNRRHSEHLDTANINKISDRCPEKNLLDPSHPYWKEYEPWTSQPPYVPQWSVPPEIHPGEYNPLPEWQGKPVLPCQWQEWAMAPPFATADLTASPPKVVYDLSLVRPYLELVYKQGWLDARAYILANFNVAEADKKLPLVPPETLD